MKPDGSSPEAEAFERARASAAAALRAGAHAVSLTPPPGAEPGRLLRTSVADAGGCLVDGRATNLEELASQILSRLGAPPFAEATRVLRAFAAHLRSRGRRLVVGIARRAELPTRTLRELGVLLQQLGGGLALVVESGGRDPELWAALGVEPTHVRASAVPRPSAGAPAPRRGRRLPLGLAAGAGLAAAAALMGILLVSRGPSRDPLVDTTAAAPLAAVAPVRVATPPEVEPEVAAPASEPERATPARASTALPGATRRRDDSDAVRNGRRALAALANARSDAAWEEGTRILHEIGPQPALLDVLDELGARPGCVRKRGCVSTRDRLRAALCTAWADAIERGEAPDGLHCS